MTLITLEEKEFNKLRAIEGDMFKECVIDLPQYKLILIELIHEAIVQQQYQKVAVLRVRLKDTKQMLQQTKNLFKQPEEKLANIQKESLS